MNENEIRQLLGEGIGEEPPITGGPAAVFAGARVRAARTRAVTVTGALSVAAVLGIAAGAVAFGGGTGGSGGSGGSGRLAPGVAAGTPTKPGRTPTTSAAAQTSETQAETSIPKPTSTTPPNTTKPTPLSEVEGPGVGLGSSRTPAPQPGAGQVLIDGRSVGEILKSMLPAGLVTGNYSGQDSYRPAKDGVRASVTMSVDDGTGKLTTLAASVAQNNPAMFKVTDCTTEQQLTHGISDCHAVAEPDGSVVLSFRSDDYTPGTNGETQGSFSYAATRVFQNGWVVSAGTSNYFDPPSDPHEKGWHIDPSRKAPLLSMDQVVTMVMNPAWGPTVSTEFAQHARQDMVPYTDDTQH